MDDNNFHSSTKRMLHEFLSPKNSDETQVFDLRGQEGRFESNSDGFPVGTRSFGLWSFLTPKIGDMIMIQRGQQVAAYVITSMKYDRTFTGSDSHRYWYGMMNNIVDHKIIVTDEIRAVLAKAGFAI